MLRKLGAWLALVTVCHNVLLFAGLGKGQEECYGNQERGQLLLLFVIMYCYLPVQEKDKRNVTEIRSLASPVSVATKLYAERQLNVSVLLAVTETILFPKPFRHSMNHFWHPIQYVHIFVWPFVFFSQFFLTSAGIIPHVLQRPFLCTSFGFDCSLFITCDAAQPAVQKATL